MKVGELVKGLEGFDPEMLVMTYVPDDNLDEITGISVKKVLGRETHQHMYGKFEEVLVNKKINVGFDAVILIA